MRPRRFVGVDWSGAASERDAARAIWTAVVEDGVLADLRTGDGRAAAIDGIVDLVSEEPETLVGLDFAFSLPGWFAAEHGWRSAAEAWRWAAAGTARDPGWVRAQEAPFWGPGIRPKPVMAGAELRRTERECAESGTRPASVLRLSGPGSVGAQSLWGMPQLLRLCDAGVAVWPFDAPRLPMAAEVFPRLLARALCPPAAGLTGEAFRRAVVDGLGASAGAHAATLAAGQDAFDAAVAALALARFAADLSTLRPARDAVDRLEGRILNPDALATTPAPASRPGPGTGR